MGEGSKLRAPRAGLGQGAGVRVHSASVCTAVCTVWAYLRSLPEGDFLLPQDWYEKPELLHSPPPLAPNSHIEKSGWNCDFAGCTGCV